MQILTREHAAYPPLLRETPLPPRRLYIEGALPDHAALDHVVAIVGTRKAQEVSCRYAALWAEKLSQAGCIIVSGMALGVDAAAHRGALRAHGTTLAVLATGIDECYPAEHRELREHIRSRGCLISEYPPGTKPRPQFFLERNRIIAGLARAVIVIEAPRRSGALATARAALEANRDVLVAPGALGDPQFAGANALIREGATLVQAIDDIMETLGDIVPNRATMTHALLTNERNSPNSVPMS